MPIAVLTLQFDPFAQLSGDIAVRWSAIALTIVIMASLVLAGLLARAAGTRVDDVVFLAIGIVPGAVVGGRIGYFLLHRDAFGAAPGQLLDPSVGGMELGLAVVGGFLSGSYVASLLGGSLRRWLSVATAPVLFALGAGKLSMALAGSGQGSPSDAPWATAYAGPGPWGSLVPTLPSHPSQLYEGFATLAILALVAVALVGSGRRADGRIFFLAIAAWATARAAASLTWRDPAIAFGFGVGGVIAIAIAIGCVLVGLALTLRPMTDRPPADDSVDAGWPAGDAGAAGSRR